MVRVKVTSDWSPIVDEQERAAARADEDAVDDARSNAPQRSGDYATSIHAAPQQRAGDRILGGIAADVPYAGVLERGYNAGPRQGPHMRAQPTLGPAGDRWGEHFERRLAESTR